MSKPWNPNKIIFLGWRIKTQV